MEGTVLGGTVVLVAEARVGGVLVGVGFEARGFADAGVAFLRVPLERRIHNASHTTIFELKVTQSLKQTFKSGWATSRTDLWVAKTKISDDRQTSRMNRD